ncbi:MAG TPA: patatin-like phospholipase family protein [Solirubrobacteraceae bacterium]
MSDVPPRVGLVLAGGGARGAYEAGALSVILPELERRGERPCYFVGASVGAINAVGLAARQHLPAAEAIEEIVQIWSRLTKDDVMRPIVSRSVAPLAARFLGQVLAVPGVRVRGLLDNAPLPHNLERWADWDRLHRAVREGAVAAVSVVATSARTGKTVAFVESAEPAAVHRSRAIAYVDTELGVEHVLASASIPVLWPATLISTPERAKGWYFDGGTRMNTPIKPLLDLGADRLVIVALESAAGPVLTRARDDDHLAAPDLGDGISHLLEGTLVDPLIDDLIKLGNINSFMVGEGAGAGPKLYRTMRGKQPYREVPYVFVAPERRGAIGELAIDVFRERYGGVRGALRSIDFRLINDLLGGPSPAHGELLSLLLFDREFIAELIAMGREDAKRWLSGTHDGGGPWRLSPLDALTLPRQWTAG